MSTSYYIQVVLSLGVMIGILYAVSALGKKVQQKRFTGDIQILDRKPLSQQASIVMVKVKNKTYLLGVGNKEVQVLDKSDDA